MMHNRVKKLVLVLSIAWLAFFALPGPRQVYDYVFGSSLHSPQYLFASSHREVCRRVRRVVEHGKVNIYVENLSTHRLHVSLTQHQIRALVIVCAAGDNP